MTQSSSPPKAPTKPLDIVHAPAVADIEGTSSVSVDAPGSRAESVRVAAPGHEDNAAAKDDAGDVVQGDDRREFGGPKGPEPTRYGDWERKGRCVDF